jgi:hypothetical protein
MRVSIENSPDQADLEIIRQGLARYNTAHAGDDQRQPLAIVVRDGQGQVQGGLLGMIYWNWMVINIVWLHEDLRGQGMGGSSCRWLNRSPSSADVMRFIWTRLTFRHPIFISAVYTIWGVWTISARSRPDLSEKDTGQRQGERYSRTLST